MNVTEPGLYPALSNEAYHEQTDWWGSTQLKAALPERYKEGGNQEAFDFGTLFHTIVLEPDKMDTFTADNGFTVLDAEKVGVKANGQPADNPTSTTAWKKAVANVVASGRRVLHKADWEASLAKAQAMADAVKAHPAAVELLHNLDGTNEESAFWIDPDTGLRHKARFDRRIPGAIIDLKSTASQPGPDNLTRAVLNYGYDASAAHYLAVAAGLGLDAGAFALVFVGKTEPYRVTVVELDDTFLARGRALRALALERLTNPAEPPYEGSTGYLTLSVPRWAQITEAS